MFNPYILFKTFKNNKSEYNNLIIKTEYIFKQKSVLFTFIKADSTTSFSYLYRTIL